MTRFEKTKRNTVVRAPDQAAYDRETIYRILDEAFVCHVGFVQDGQPFVIPTLHARRDDALLLHGATKSRLMEHMEAGNEVCVSVTLLDGLVLARSVFHHSVNYRSAVLFGAGSLVGSDEEKLRALECFTERVMPGRWADVRKPNHQELKATSVVSIAIDSAAAKVSVGPPEDNEEDYQLPVWAGVLPIRRQFGPLENDPKLSSDIPVPEYLGAYLNERYGRAEPSR